MSAPDLSFMPQELEGFRRRALYVGAAGLAACAIGWWLDPARFFQSWLAAWIFWGGLAFGSLALLMIQHLTGGAWAVMVRRPLESMLRTLPLVALLFVPLLLGMPLVYEWARPEVVAADEILQHKALYLNVPFFAARAAAFLALWTGMGWLLCRWSERQDVETWDERAQVKFRALSGPGLVVFAITMTFAATDWVMSLEPHWFSTIFGALIMAGQALGSLSLGIAIVIVLSRYRPLSQVLTPRHMHDLGKLLLAFVMVWAYFSFSQFLIIWAGNLPEEIPWYLRRLHGGWQWLALALLGLHFVLPFLLLLSRDLKRDGRRLALVAVMMLIMHFVDTHWMVAPAFELEDLATHTHRHRTLADIHWLDLAAPLGLGGIWLWAFLGQLRRRALLPLKDPALEEAMQHVGH